MSSNRTGEIIFKKVSKKYNISSVRHALLVELIGNLFNPKKENYLNKKNQIWALKDLTFTINPGEAVGIIGRNGAGKSTILKLISKVVYPTLGSITINGRIGALIELGAGLHPELTGKENIFLYGAILGMTRKEIKRKFDEIVDFAELDKFLDTPIKHYSSGMNARLGFSVAAFTNPDILLIDEVLAVGDISFQNKCFAKMDEIKNSGATLVFVSHNPEYIKRICNKVIWLEKGKVKKIGKPETLLKEYLK